MWKTNIPTSRTEPKLRPFFGIMKVLLASNVVTALIGYVLSLKVCEVYAMRSDATPRLKSLLTHVSKSSRLTPSASVFTSHSSLLALSLNSHQQITIGTGSTQSPRKSRLESSASLPLALFQRHRASSSLQSGIVEMRRHGKNALTL